MLASYSKTLTLLLYPIIGFISAILLWSIFVGDFNKTQIAAAIPGLPSLPLFQTEPASDDSADTPIWSSWSRIQNIFVFGDSYSTTYFNPEGNQPTNELPFGNTDFLGGFDSGEGPKWIQYLKVMYKADQPLRVYNFATTGGVVDRHAYNMRPQGIGASSECVSLKEQVRCWMKNYALPAWRNVERVWKPDNTLFALWFGVHDILQAMEKDSPVAIDPVFGSYSASFERLYREGARNFLLINTPMIDRGLGDPTGQIKLGIRAFNTKLVQSRSKWLRRYKDATIFLFDAHKMMSDILENHRAFDQTVGLRELKRICPAYRMGAPTLEYKSPECDFARDLYFWMNEISVTHRIHDAVAAHINSDCFHAGGPIGYCT